MGIECATLDSNTLSIRPRLPPYVLLHEKMQIIMAYFTKQVYVHVIKAGCIIIIIMMILLYIHDDTCMFAYLPHWLVGREVRGVGSVRGAPGLLQTWASSVRGRLACRWIESSRQTLPPYHSRSPGRMIISAT